MDYVEEFKRGGKVKRKKKIIKKRIVRKKKQPKDKITKHSDTKVSMLPQGKKGFEFFGYEVPTQRPQQQPPNEQMFASLAEQLKKSKDEQDELRKQIKQIEDVKSNQQSSGQALVSYSSPQRQNFFSAPPPLEKVIEEKGELEFKEESIKPKIKQEHPFSPSPSQVKIQDITGLNQGTTAASKKRMAERKLEIDNAIKSKDVNELKRLLKNAKNRKDIQESSYLEAVIKKL
jgi:hypothetical protein